jgi:hypothetical protein
VSKNYTDPKTDEGLSSCSCLRGSKFLEEQGL